MNFQIEDQLIKGYILGSLISNSVQDVLISQMALSTAIFGIFYKDGVLTITNIESDATEAFVEDGILKLK